MLNRAGEQSVDGVGLARARQVDEGEADLVGAGHGGVDGGEGQAALLVRLLALAGQHLGVEHNQRHGDGRVGLHILFLLGIFGDVDHAEALIAPDLGGGEADAIGVVHGLDHVDRQPLEVLGEDVDGAAGRAEHRVAPVTEG